MFLDDYPQVLDDNPLPLGKRPQALDERPQAQNERGKLVQDNIEKIKEFWNVINDILKTGKTIFKANPVKIKEYTQTQILSRIRHEISPEAAAKNIKKKVVV